jgi:hypothetical protein
MKMDATYTVIDMAGRSAAGLAHPLEGAQWNGGFHCVRAYRPWF